MMYPTHKDVKPWVNKKGHIQLRARKKHSMVDPETFVVISVRAQAAHQATPPRDSWAIIASFPLVDDPDVSHRTQANRYLRMIALALGHGSFIGSYEL